MVHALLTSGALLPAQGPVRWQTLLSGCWWQQCSSATPATRCVLPHAHLLMCICAIASLQHLTCTQPPRVCTIAAVVIDSHLAVNMQDVACQSAAALLDLLCSGSSSGSSGTASPNECQPDSQPTTAPGDSPLQPPSGTPPQRDDALRAEATTAPPRSAVAAPPAAACRLGCLQHQPAIQALQELTVIVAQLPRHRGAMTAGMLAQLRALFQSVQPSIKGPSIQAGTHFHEMLNTSYHGRRLCRPGTCFYNATWGCSSGTASTAARIKIAADRDAADMGEDRVCSLPGSRAGRAAA